MLYDSYDGDLVAAAQETRLDLLDALGIFRAVLRGAAVLHAAGRAHGDVKSQNVLARWRDHGHLTHVALSDVGASHYTPAWLPTDQLRSPPCAVTDVYAAALLFVDAASGCHGPLPPDQRTPEGVRAALQAVRPPPGGPSAKRQRRAYRRSCVDKAANLAWLILGKDPADRVDATAALALVDALHEEFSPAP
eukprot:TRINITY_DN3813_c2_g2_i1.p1 TRINITY_DN3813_c2_g2~~TRINITY_DN3813_c2_g2_i1.p1  ORF type:complete len:192 (+),score=48.13 TRINITY_DN3813_c2_g2_i1:718-1293(+)